MINTLNEVECPLLWLFWIYNFSRRRNKQIARERFAFSTRFVCPALRFIPHELRKKTLIPWINITSDSVYLNVYDLELQKKKKTRSIKKLAVKLQVVSMTFCIQQRKYFLPLWNNYRASIRRITRVFCHHVMGIWFEI